LGALLPGLDKAAEAVRIAPKKVLGSALKGQPFCEENPRSARNVADDLGQALHCLVFHKLGR
jgi:hypothetical protein